MKKHIRIFLLLYVFSLYSYPWWKLYFSFFVIFPSSTLQLSNQTFAKNRSFNETAFNNLKKLQRRMDNNPQMISSLLSLYHEEQQHIFRCEKIRSEICATLHTLSQQQYKKCSKKRSYNSSSLRS